METTAGFQLGTDTTGPWLDVKLPDGVCRGGSHPGLPCEVGGACPACAGYSRAYIHHLFRNNEMLGGMLLSAHNLHFYQDLMAALRDGITAERFAAVAEDWRATLSLGDVAQL